VQVQIAEIDPRGKLSLIPVEADGAGDVAAAAAPTAEVEA
jgi:hypothetical protein